MVAPWTVWWRRNFFADVLPGLHAVMASPAARAAVVATGVITIFAGLREFRGLIAARMARRGSSADVETPRL